MDLPTLTGVPSRHPDCCLSLSSSLLDILTSSIQERIGSGLVLSVGSGTGLLEALLYSKWTSSATPFLPNGRLQIEGVEVCSSESIFSPTINKYLPEQCYETVRGTWAVSTRGEDAVALLFVYPRSSQLVEQYMQRFSVAASKLRTVVWLGPKCDWPEFAPSIAPLQGWLPVHILNGEEAGLADYEMMAVTTRSRTGS